IEGFGTPVVGTATLIEKAEPYDLLVELARGKLNDVRNQAADWVQMGLVAPPELDEELGRAQKAFAAAATSRDDAPRAQEKATECLAASFRAGPLLTESYTAQVLQKRLEHSQRLTTLFACGLEADPRQEPWAEELAATFNAARVRCSWAALEPAEG